MASPTRSLAELIRHLETGPVQQGDRSQADALFWLRAFSAQVQALEAGGSLPQVPQVPLPLPEDLRVKEQNVSYDGIDDEILSITGDVAGNVFARGVRAGRSWVQVTLEGPVTAEVQAWLKAAQRRS